MMRLSIYSSYKPNLARVKKLEVGKNQEITGKATTGDPKTNLLAGFLALWAEDKLGHPNKNKLWGWTSYVTWGRRSHLYRSSGG